MSRIDAVGSVSALNQRIINVKETEKDNKVLVPAQEEKKLQREDVIATSSDGDTVQAKKSAIEASKEGVFFTKNAKETEQTGVKRAVTDIKSTRKEEEKADREIKSGQKKDDTINTNLSGYTNDQVEQLYNQGKINYSDYNKELDRREKVKEQTNRIEEKDENKKVIAEDKAETQDLRSDATKQYTDTQKEIVRDDEQRVTENKASKDVKENFDTVEDKDSKNNSIQNDAMSKEIEDNKDFIDTMSNLSGIKAQDKLESDAYKAAVESGRSDIVKQIFEHN